MSNLQRNALVLAAICGFATAAIAQKASIRLPADNALAQLKSGPGEDVVRKDCGFCHSTDYIVIQPHMTAQQWDAEVKKMIAVYGAAIGAGDVKTIADYLARNYAAANTEPKNAQPSKSQP